MRALLVVSGVLLTLPACAGDDGPGSAGEVTSSGGTSQTATVSTSAPSSSSEGPTGSSASMTMTEGTTTITATTTSTDPTATETGSTTTGLEICHFGGTGESGGSRDPWLELTHKGVAVEDGVAVGLECGLQGLFMLEFVPYFGGFELEDEYVSLSMTVDVDGYNVNPDGHFYSAEELSFYVGCEVFDGGISYIIPVIPSDTIDDLAALDGAAGQISMTMTPDGGGAPVTVESTFTIAAQVDEMWEFCGYAP